MAQAARPSSDITVGSWTTASLYQRLDEVTPDDSDYIESPETPSSAVCEVKLSALTDPSSSSDHRVRYRYAKSAPAGEQVDLTVRLMEGAVERASWVHTDMGAAVVQATQALSVDQADSISDYSDLRLRFIANAP